MTRVRLVASLTVAVVVGGALLASPVRSVAEPRPLPALLDAEAAMVQAKKSGQPTVATALTDEHTLVTADPGTGLMVADMSAGVARVPNGTGGWRAPSATLAQSADGSWHPEAAATGVTISNGGSGSFLNLADSAGSIAFTWPGVLPVPHVDANLATYSEVVPGVDLVVRASVDGAESFLVVKTAEAAQNSAVRSVPITVSAKGLNPGAHANGAVSYTDSAGQGHFMLPPAYMWDSGGQAPGAPTTDLLDPAEGAQVEALAASVSKTAKTALSASDTVARMLDDPDTVYPVVIDPSASMDQTYAVRVTQEFVKYNSDIGDRGKIGYNGWASPYYKSRMFYQFKWPTYNGNYIEAARIYKAEFSYVQTHSPQHDCGDHSFGPSVKVQFYNTINGDTKWDGPDVHSGIGSKTNDYAVGDEDYCHASYTQKWDVTSMAIAERIKSSTRTTVTVGILSSDESDKNGWREYKNNSSSPDLTVWYETTPPAPTALLIAPLTPSGAAGVTNSSGPTLRATVTLTAGKCPDIDPYQQGCVRAHFTVANGATPVYSGDTAATVPGNPVSLTVPAGTLSDNTTYTVTAVTHNVATGSDSGATSTTLTTDFAPAASTITLPAGGWAKDSQLTVAASNTDPTVSYRWKVAYNDSDGYERTDSGTWNRPAGTSGSVSSLPVGAASGYTGQITVTIWPLDSHGNEGPSWVSDSTVLH